MKNEMFMSITMKLAGLVAFTSLILIFGGIGFRAMDSLSVGLAGLSGAIGYFILVNHYADVMEDRESKRTARRERYYRIGD